MARIYLATEENQKTIINNQGALKQDHVDLKKNQNEILTKLNQGGDSDISTMAAAWTQGINGHTSSWIVSSGKVGQVLNKLGGGLYSAINNCTTVKQVLDNAATWQQMVKNNLIVYCIEQSDDFMKTLVDYPDRLYELVSNEYMQTLMGRSGRCVVFRQYGDVSVATGHFIPAKITYESRNDGSSYFTVKYSDGITKNFYPTNTNSGDSIAHYYLKDKRIINVIEINRSTDMGSELKSYYFYDLTKPTI